MIGPDGKEIPLIKDAETGEVLDHREYAEDIFLIVMDDLMSRPLDDPFWQDVAPFLVEAIKVAWLKGMSEDVRIQAENDLSEMMDLDTTDPVVRDALFVAMIHAAAAGKCKELTAAVGFFIFGFFAAKGLGKSNNHPKGIRLVKHSELGTFKDAIERFRKEHMNWLNEMESDYKKQSDAAKWEVRGDKGEGS